VNAEAVIHRLARVYTARDWAELRTLYHPEAAILTVTGGPSPLGAGEIVDELQRASSDLVYFVEGSPPIAVDEHAAIVTGRMRWRRPHGAYEDASHVWLFTVRDGLIYRQGVYGHEAEAIAAYERLGVELGVPARE
jgi:hypothetical protein